MSEKQLTGKQKAFINFYLLTYNGTQSARMAKYKGSESVLGAVAHENLRKPQIRAEIEKRLESCAMGANEALAHIGAIARDYERHDQLKALELLAKHLGLFEDRMRIEMLQINFGELTDNQVRRIANGENYVDVLGDKS